MARLLNFAAALALVMSLSACATVTRGSKDTWTANTTPGGAAVSTTNGFSCPATPCTFKMSRKSEFQVTIIKPGYKIWTGQVTNRISGAGGAGMAGNVLVGGLIGAGIDVSSGAMRDLTPNPLNVILEPDEGGPLAAPSQAQRQQAVAPRSTPAPSAPPAQTAPPATAPPARVQGSVPPVRMPAPVAPSVAPPATTAVPSTVDRAPRERARQPQTGDDSRLDFLFSR